MAGDEAARGLCWAGGGQWLGGASGGGEGDRSEAGREGSVEGEGEGEEQGGPPASRIMPTRGRLAAGIDAGGRRSEGKGEVGAWRSSPTSR